MAGAPRPRSSDRSLNPARIVSALVFAAVAAGSVSQISAQDEPLEGDQLPDIVVPSSFLNDTVIQRSGVRRLLRLSNGTANVGTGPLHLYGVLPGNGDGSQDVRQRVFNRDGTFYDRVAGQFEYHPTHQHIHFDDWATYRLRRRIGEEGVGEIVAEGAKQSFCIIDLEVYNPSLPGFPSRGRFRSCASTTQGLSVGWVDVYDKSIPGQTIDVTEVPDGHYWLESEVDPHNVVLESDETNNVTRVPYTLGNPPDIVPDGYEPNDAPENVRALKIGAPNSANVGPSDPKFTTNELTIHSEGDTDYFRFYANHVGGPGDFVRVDFDHARGNVDLELLDDDGAVIASSATNENFERISLEGRPEGWYFVRAFGRAGDLSPSYRVTINPPANQPPAIEVTTPEADGADIRHALDLFEVFWSAVDPEGDEMWVSVYFSENRELDETSFLVATTQHTPASYEFAVINTAEVPEGNYWIYCQVTDGGTTMGNWSPGQLRTQLIGEECIDLTGDRDCNGNGSVDACDIDFGSSLDCNGNGRPDECELADGSATDSDGDGTLDECEQVPFHRADPNDDGETNVSDAVTLVGYLFQGTTGIPCLESADVDNDWQVSLTDIVFLLDYLFRQGPRPAEPGAVAFACGFDEDAAGSEGFLGCDSYTHCGES